MKKLVSFSAGLDSTTLLWQLEKQKEEEDEIIPLFVRYGQVWSYEELSSCRLAKLLGLDLVVLGGEQLVLGTRWEKERVGYIPMRNPYLMSVALNYAVEIGAEEIYFGLTGDCRYGDVTPEFLDRFNFMAQEALAQLKVVPPILAPFSDSDTMDLVRIGQELEVPYHYTFSCFRQPREGERALCGLCPKCLDRWNIFRLLGHRKDPAYELVADFNAEADFEKALSWSCYHAEHEDCDYVGCRCQCHKEG